MPAPADESERILELSCTQSPAIGVQSQMSWPCGQDFQLKPGCHRRRDLRYEARSVSYWF